MGSASFKIRFAWLSVFAFGLVTACTAKEAKKETGAKEPTSLPEPAVPVDDNPCLRLQDEDEDEAEDTATESGEETEDEESEDEDTADDEEATDDVGSTSDCGDSTPDPTPTPSGGSTGGTWNDGPGLEGCAAEGKAWIAVKSGGPAECGPALVTWCCSEAEILKQFPSLATKLQGEFDKRKDLKLYHCSFDGTESRFHWAKYDDGGIKYSTVYVKGAGKVGGTAGAECTKVTSADLGIPAESAGGDEGDDDDEVVEVGDDIPATIGPITDTSKAGMLAWAQEHNNYSSRDNSIRTTTAHGRVKGFYSSNLKTSMADFDTKHPVGAVAILELFGATGDTLKGYAVMAKATAATGASSWLFYKIEGAPEFADVPAAYGLGVESCAGDCHSDSTKDHVKRETLP